MICLLMDGGSEAPSQGSRLNGGDSPFQHSLALCIWSFPFLVFHLSDLQFVSFFVPLPSLLLRSAFVPVHHVHRVSFFLTASSDPRYSSSSPEDTLIPRFPSRSTHRKKRAPGTDLQSTFAGVRICSKLQTFAFLRQHFVFTDVA